MPDAPRKSEYQDECRCVGSFMSAVCLDCPLGVPEIVVALGGCGWCPVCIAGQPHLCLETDPTHYVAEASDAV